MGGGIGAHLASCIAVFVRAKSEPIVTAPFVEPHPPILQVIDYSMTVRNRDVRYYFSTWSAPPVFDEDWLIAAGVLPGGMLRLSRGAK